MTQWRKALLDQLAAVLEEYDLPELIDVNVLLQDSAPRQRAASNDAGAHEDLAAWAQLLPTSGRRPVGLFNK